MLSRSRGLRVLRFTTSPAPSRSSLLETFSLAYSKIPMDRCSSSSTSTSTQPSRIPRRETRRGIRLGCVDVLVELDEHRSMGIFEYARLKVSSNELLDGAGDVVNRRTLKPLLRDNILRDAIHAF